MTDNEDREPRGLRVSNHGSTTTVRYDDESVELPNDDAARSAAMIVLSQIDGDSVLLEAYNTGRERGQQYGPPTENFTAAAELFGSYFGADAVPSDYAVAMMLAKISRIKTGGMDREHLVDIAGYARAAAIAEGYDDAGV
jgi:hypothetical protein